MDQKFMKAMSDQENTLKSLKTLHLGALGLTFWLPQFISRYAKCPFLEEIGWAITGPVARVDLNQLLENCPNLYKLYLDMQRSDIKNVHLNTLI